tara:strand:- start:6610 stop:8091 length:1482 start_codon:yes stop_codon:yes gene_type:complete
MGFFKKIFKPVSKVLNKVIPNELKPLLPYAAAFAPYLAGPGIVGASGFQGMLANPYLRAAMTGGLNIGSQLAQEGNEGEVNALSAGLGALQGFGTAAGAQSTLEGFKSPMGDFAPARSGLMKFKDRGLDYLISGADKLQSAGNILSGDGRGLNMATVKAAAAPLTLGTGDAMLAESNRAMKDYEKALLDYENSLAEGEFATDEGRRAAIIAAMTAGKHTQAVIDSTLSELGLKDGGRVSKMNGGIMNAKRGLVDAPGGYAGEGPDFGGLTEAVKNVNEDKQRAYMELLDTESIDMEADLRMERLNNLIEEGMSEDEAFKLVMPNAFSNDGKTDSEGRTIEIEINEKTDPIIKDYASYSKPRDLMESVPPQYRMNKDQYSEERDNQDTSIKERFMYGFDTPADKMINFFTSKAKGGIIGLNMGGSVLPQGIEMDYRGGGFIPMGSKEKADDVPARVSKNEFVMTADAVKAAGGGSVNKGAKRMYNLMNNLEARV